MDIASRANHEREWRSFDVTEFEFRDDGPTGFTFEGVASVVDAPYAVRDMFGEFTETIQAGAFDKTLRDSKADVALYVNHDYSGIPLASRGSGSLTLAADPNLRVIATLNPRRSDVMDLREAVLDGIMRQMSIGFSVPKNRDTWNDDYTQRSIREVKLYEVSSVWKGANHLTSAGMRSLDELLTIDLTEDELRRAITVLQSRLVEPVDDEIAVRDLADKARLERKRLLRPEYLAA